MDCISKELWKIVTFKCNNIYTSGLLKDVRKLIVENYHVGFILESIAEHLLRFADVFSCVTLSDEEVIMLNPDLKTFEDRTNAVRHVLETLRDEDVLEGLKCWRNETNGVYTQDGFKPLLQIERAGSSLLGTLKFGVHINGYTIDKNGDYKDMWIAKRSDSKLTYPGQMDNMVAGGLDFYHTPRECVIKECQEEASIPIELLEKVKPVGTLSAFYQDKRGINSHIMYCFDLILPENFTPVNSDGEVDGFIKIPCSELRKFVAEQKVKSTSAFTMIDFMIRHGFITHENDPKYAQYGCWLHSKFPLD